MARSKSKNRRMQHVRKVILKKRRDRAKVVRKAAMAAAAAKRGS